MVYRLFLQVLKLYVLQSDNTNDVQTYTYTRTRIKVQIQIQITLLFPEIVPNNYMGIYKMNHRITYCINSDMVEFNRGS